MPCIFRQVALNGDADYGGGRLVFATSIGFVIPARPAGTATIHTDRIVHGVTALTGGVRYGLFLCDATVGGLSGTAMRWLLRAWS